ncbi:P-type DNA transfer ATPase VirB11 [Rosenbergiella epipactidis]|uniref:P-type DNA transfer ATPase VirB11 n=1 Tax=Rosenbergiella epipactidis TaxID=1544694 RepID=UPI001F4F482F|nr:P-type DNA transfer ATPase VirB11 [Rosenbergiella epipactidis]
MSTSTNALERQLGPLQRYFSDPTVFEIRINRFGEVVCDKFDGRHFYHDAAISETFIQRLTQALLSYNGIQRQAINNLLLPDGSRGIICLPPAVHQGTTAVAFRKNISLNKPLSTLDQEGIFNQCRAIGNHEFGLQASDHHLLDLFSQQAYQDFLEYAVKHKKTIVVAGETGSGKTVLTRALLECVDPTERVILIEDVHEVSAEHLQEVVYMRYSTESHTQLITPTDCLKACMRLTPDRIFMTELRDQAAWDYIQMLNTGHPGGLTSTHANSARDTFQRIGLLIKATEIGKMLEYQDIMRLLYSTLDIVVYMEKRKIKEIYFDPQYKYSFLNK